MTGSDVTSTLKTLGLNRIQLADLIGVNSSTVYRWEHAEGELRMDPRQTHLMLICLGIAAKPDARRLGLAIRKAIKENPLYGLYRLLQIGVGDATDTNV